MSYIFFIVAILISLGSSLYIKSKYSQTKKIENSLNMTGKEVALKIAKSNGLDIQVGAVEGELSDHYNPLNKTVNLSQEIYGNSSCASIAVAAHECGHAIQDKNDYFFLRLRRRMIPVVNLASSLGYVAILIGVIAELSNFILIGIVFECVILFFSLVTLPVEFDASRRGLGELKKLGFSSKDLGHAKGMLTSAALTYVASTTNSLLQVLRLVIMFRNRRD